MRKIENGFGREEAQETQERIHVCVFCGAWRQLSHPVNRRGVWSRLVRHNSSRFSAVRWIRFGILTLITHLKKNDTRPAAARSWHGKGGAENRKRCKIRKIEFSMFFDWNLLPPRPFQPKVAMGILRILRKIPGGHPRGGTTASASAAPGETPAATGRRPVPPNCQSSTCGGVQGSPTQSHSTRVRPHCDLASLPFLSALWFDWGWKSRIKSHHFEYIYYMQIPWSATVTVVVRGVLCRTFEQRCVRRDVEHGVRSNRVKPGQTDFFKLLTMNDLQTHKTGLFGLSAVHWPEKSRAICFLMGRFCPFLHP